MTTSRRAGAAGTPPRKPVALATVAIRLLARREYGRAELAAKLVAKGGTQPEIDATLDDLERRGYLSDARFAQALVHQKTGRYGRIAIAHALKERKVDPDVAKAALATVAQGDEAADARALWQRRFGVAPKNDKERARQIRFLMARGYPTGVALAVVRKAAAKGADDQR